MFTCRCTHALILLLFIAFARTAFAVIYTGKVIGISDGDTIKILVNQTQHKVRLAEIDTPENGQPYGKKAKQALSKLVFGKTVKVEQKDIDRYGRIVGRVYVDSFDVNAEMIRGGHGWVYRKYATDQTLYVMEGDAKRNRRGLWALPEAQRVPPWEWRHGSRSAGRIVKQEGVGGSFTCGSKRYCRHMSSCAEAIFYMEQCGLIRLDGDRDGVPCEKICRSRTLNRTIEDKPIRRSFTCGSKRYCRHMSSCAEARFYMEQCGLIRLDGDRDGVPCERICR